MSGQFKLALVPESRWYPMISHDWTTRNHPSNILSPSYLDLETAQQLEFSPGPEIGQVDYLQGSRLDAADSKSSVKVGPYHGRKERGPRVDQLPLGD